MASPEKPSSALEKTEKKKCPYDLGAAIKSIFMKEKQKNGGETQGKLATIQREISPKITKEKHTSLIKKNKKIPTKKTSIEQILPTDQHNNMLLATILEVTSDKAESEEQIQKIYSQLGLGISTPMNSREFANAVRAYQTTHNEERLVSDGWIQYRGKTWNSLLQKAKAKKENTNIDSTYSSWEIPKIKLGISEKRVVSTRYTSVSVEPKENEINFIKSIPKIETLEMNFVTTNNGLDLSSMKNLKKISFTSIHVMGNFFTDMLPTSIEEIYLPNMTPEEAKKIDWGKLPSLLTVQLSDTDGRKNYTIAELSALKSVETQK